MEEELCVNMRILTQIVLELMDCTNTHTAL
jgi:hypothetical protein